MSYSAKHFRDLSERDVKNIVHPRHAIASIKTGEMPIGISAFMNSFESKNVQLNRIFNKIENGDIFIIAFSRPFHGVISADGKPLNSNLTHAFQSKLKTLNQRRRKVSMPRKKASATSSGEEEESVFEWPRKDENGNWRMRFGPSSWDNLLNAFDSFGVKKDTDGDTILSIGKEAKADPNLIEDVGLGDLVSGAIAGATGGKILNNAVPKKLATPKNKPGTNHNGDITPEDSKTITGGEPISLVTGEEILTLADFDLPGPCPLVWERTYKSSHRLDVGLGHGWTHSFAEKLDIRDPDTVVYHTSEARLVPFVAPRVGQSITHETEQLILTYHGDNHYSIRPSDGAGLSRHFALKHKTEPSLLLTEVRNAFNAGIQLHYNDNSRLSEILGTGNARWTLDYDGPHIRRIDHHLSDGSTHTQVRYHYDEQNDLIQASDRNKQSEYYAYDKHQISCRTLKSGYRFYFEWSDTTTAARCVHNWGDHVQGNGNPKHGIATYDYKFAWQPEQKAVAITDTRGGVERYRFNDLGLPIYHQDQEGGETHYTYDDYGNLLSTTDALGHVERRAYDDQQQLNQMTDSQGRTLRFKRNAAGEVVETVDVLGQPWRNTYNEQGLLHTETNPLGETTTYTYNVLGLPESIRNPMGDTWRYIWNDLGQLTAIRNPQGQHVLYQYTPMGDLQKITLPDGNSTKYHYNSGGQCTRIDTPDGQSQQFKYNSLGLLTEHQQGDGRITRYDYNGLSQVVKRTDSLGHILHYRYDGERNLIGLINEKGEHYQLTYDLNERLIEEVGFDGRRQRYEYNAVGHLIASEEYRAGSNICLSRLRYKRDAQGRLLEQFLEIHRGEATQEPLKQFAYDRAGRLIAAVNAHSALKWDYDAVGRLVQVTQNGKVLRHELDALGHRTQSTLPNGDQIQYAWDKDGQHQSIHFNGHTVVDFTRDALGREIGRQHGNQLQTHSSYDPQGRLQAQKLSNASTTLNQRQYHYNQAGQLSQIDDQRRGSTRYNYDAIDRLVSVQGPQPETFVHDPAGNLLSACDGDDQQPTEQNNPRQVQHNRLNFFGDQHYAYDDQGNRTQTLRGKGQQLVTNFAYDALNQLIKVDNQGNITTYEYDPLGRRIAKRSADKTTTFLWNDDVLLSETTTHIESDNQESKEDKGKQTKHKTYLFEPDSFTPVAFVQNDEIYHYHTDHLGTPQDITNAQGNIVWSANYRAYGNLALANVEEVENNLRFQGQYFDEETGLHYNRFRYYDPNCGRFINQDPIGLMGGLNCYQYAPNPVQWVDPLGLTAAKEDPSRQLNSIASSKPDFYGTADGTTIIAPQGVPGKQSPWPVGLEPIHSTTLPVGTKFNMAMSPGQAATRPGGFGTFDDITNRNFVRDKLAVIREFKKQGDLERVEEFEVIQPLPAKSGLVGPQIEVDNGQFRPGGAHQIEMLVSPKDRINYIRPTGNVTYFDVDDPDT